MTGRNLLQALVAGIFLLGQIATGSELPVEERERLDGLVARWDTLQKADKREENVQMLRQLKPEAISYLIDLAISENRLDEKQHRHTLYMLQALDQHAKWPIQARWAKLNDHERWRLMPYWRARGFEDTIGYVIGCLRSQDFEICRNATSYLYQFPDPRAKPVLLEQMPISLQRWEMINILVKIGGEDVVDALIPLLEPDSWAAKGVGMIPPPGEMWYPWPPDGRDLVIRHLAELNAKKCEARLLEILWEKHPEKPYMARVILPALVKFQTPGGKEAMLKVLQAAETSDPKPTIPPEIAGDMIERDKALVRQAAALGLLQWGDLSGQPVLVEQTRHTNNGVRLGAVTALAEHGDQSALPVLQQLLEDKDKSVKREASKGVSRLTKVGK